MIGFTDTGLTPDTSYTYRISAADPDGNTALADNLTITTPSSGNDPTAGAYPQDVLDRRRGNYWRLDRLARHRLGLRPGRLQRPHRARRGQQRGRRDQRRQRHRPDVQRLSSNGYAYSSGAAATAPNTFSIGAWFKTTPSAGGKIVGFGNSQTGDSGSLRPALYLDNTGRVYFGVYHNATYTINTSRPYRDGNWHQVVATLSSDGMALYVDGALVGTNTGTTVGPGLQRLLAGRRGQPHRLAGRAHQQLLQRLDRRRRDLPGRATRSARCASSTWQRA